MLFSQNSKPSDEHRKILCICNTAESYIISSTLVLVMKSHMLYPPDFRCRILQMRARLPLQHPAFLSVMYRHFVLLFLVVLEKLRHAKLDSCKRVNSVFLALQVRI